MIAIRGLAVAAIFGCAAIALAPGSGADPARETFSIRFNYDAGKPVLDNYVAFARQAERVCTITNGQRMASRWIDRACVDNVLDQVVGRMNRPQLAAIHDLKTGVRADSSRTLAAR